MRALLVREVMRVSALAGVGFGYRIDQHGVAGARHADSRVRIRPPLTSFPFAGTMK